MPLLLTVSCSSKILIVFLVPADLGTPGKRAVKRVCVCVWLISTCMSVPPHHLAGYPGHVSVLPSAGNDHRPQCSDVLPLQAHSTRWLNAVASKTKAGPGAVRLVGPLRRTQTCTKLASFIQSTGLVSLKNTHIVAELDFGCIYFLPKTCSLYPGPYDGPGLQVHCTSLSSLLDTTG